MGAQVQRRMVAMGAIWVIMGYFHLARPGHSPVSVISLTTWFASSGALHQCLFSGTADWILSNVSLLWQICSVPGRGGGAGSGNGLLGGPSAL